MINDLKAMEMDMISDLPGPILHHILSHLSQNDAVKTCVLSKSWRYLWHGRLNVEFSKDDFKGFSVKKFISVLNHTLVRYDTQNLSIQKFVFKRRKRIDPVSARLLEKWIPKIVMRNKKCLETFHLSFHKDMDSSVYFGLPSVIFLFESLREIHLAGCMLNQINSSTNKVLFRHLQTLCLRNVKITEKTFERIMSSCPLVEEVSLIRCEGLKTIKVNNHNCSLKYFEFRSYYHWSDPTDHQIEIADVAHIETIKIKRCPDWFEHHHNNLFTSLKSLHLSSVHLTTKSVHSFSCNFPCLEELEFSYCFDKFEEFELSIHSVKRLVIGGLRETTKVSIDAPNMLEFEYKGGKFPSHISFTTTSNNKWKSKISMTTFLDDENLNYVSQWLQKLDELLKVLSPSETSLHIVVACFFDYYRCDGAPDNSIQEVVKHLELCLGSQLCFGYSVWLAVESMWKTLIESSDSIQVAVKHFDGSFEKDSDDDSDDSDDEDSDDYVGDDSDSPDKDFESNHSDDDYDNSYSFDKDSDDDSDDSDDDDSDSPDKDFESDYSHDDFDNSSSFDKDFDDDSCMKASN